MGLSSNEIQNAVAKAQRRIAELALKAVRLERHGEEAAHEYEVIRYISSCQKALQLTNNGLDNSEKQWIVEHMIAEGELNYNYSAVPVGFVPSYYRISDDIEGGTVTSISATDSADIDFTVTSPTTTPVITAVLTTTGVAANTYASVTVDTKGRVTAGSTTLAVTLGGTGTSTAFTQGSVVFAGASGVYAQDNANFFWNDSTNRLGIGTASPNNTIQVVNLIDFNNTNETTYIGYQVGLSTTGSGVAGVGVGYQALFSNTNGRDNVAVGHQSLYTNTTGSRNTAIGRGSMIYNTIGDNNTAVGYDSLITNVSGTESTAIGYRALRLNTASNNTAVGSNALLVNVGGTYNTAIGSSALAANTTGQQNTAVGRNSLLACIGGSTNVAVGDFALAGVTSGNYNVGLGSGAGQSITTGSNNIIIGNATGSSLAGASSQNTMLSGLGDFGSASRTNTTLLGYGATATSDNQFIFGNSSAVNWKVAGVDYVWPTSQGAASTFLQNNGSGTLSWTTAATAGLVSGTGTANTMAKWTSTTAIGNSLVTDNGTTVSITGTSSIFTVIGTTDATSTTTGSLKTAGGLGVVKAVWIGTDINLASGVNHTISVATASTGRDLTIKAGDGTNVAGITYILGSNSENLEGGDVNIQGGTSNTLTGGNVQIDANTGVTANGSIYLGSNIQSPLIKLTGTQLQFVTGTPGVGKVLTDDGSGTGIAVWTTGGTVTSVAQTFTGGLISVSGSPITSSGTLALTVAGTSGGVPYFSSASTWASSAALAANAIVIGGGAGAAPSTTTTGTGILTFLGTPSSANLAAAVTDETGSGALVFGTAPNFTTSITSPIVYGSSSASGSLTLTATSSGTDGAVIFQSDPTTESGRFTSTQQFLVGTTSALGAGDVANFYRNANDGTYIRVTNATSGTIAQAGFVASTDNGATSVQNIIYSAGYTSSGIAVASTAVYRTTAAGGLNMGTTAATQLSLWTNNVQRMNINSSGYAFFGGSTSATSAWIQLGAGTTTVAPLRFTSGAIPTGGNILAGNVAFLTDDLYFTITTGTAVKQFVFTDGSVLTSGKIPVATTNGRLVDMTASSAYTITNGTTDRAMDCNATTVEEVADLVYTMWSDLNSKGILG